jgi:hypothetical protein
VSTWGNDEASLAPRRRVPSLVRCASRDALDESKSKGWTVVDMKADWKRVFPQGE